MRKKKNELTPVYITRISVETLKRIQYEKIRVHNANDRSIALLRDEIVT